MNNSGRLIVFAAPAGGGKSTLIRRIRDAHPAWGFSVSATTREPRPGEQNGREYYFLTVEDFQRRLQAGEFLEHEEVHGNEYGTLLGPTRERMEKGETIIFDLDVKGALSIKQAFPQALTIFLLPPSLEILRARLVNRQTETPEVIERRMQRVTMEMAMADQFDRRIVNDDLEQTVAAVEQAIRAYLEQ